MNHWTHIQDKAAQATFPPSQDLWDRIEMRLGSERRSSFWKRWRFLSSTAAGVLVFVMATFYFYPSADSGYVLENLDYSAGELIETESLQGWYNKDQPIIDQHGILMPNYSQFWSHPILVNQKS